MIKKITAGLIAFALLAWGASWQLSAQIPTTTGHVYLDGPVGFSIASAKTPANSSHALGTSNGGLLTIPFARNAVSGAVITSIGYKSVGASVGLFVVRMWYKSPANTTCTDNVAFAGSDTDDAFLIAPPFSLTPAAPGAVTGDSATYAQLTALSWGFKNADAAPTNNIYVCFVNSAINTADNNKVIRLTVSGQQ